MNSKLIANQTKGEFEVRDLTMAKYLKKVQTLIFDFKFSKIFHVP